MFTSGSRSKDIQESDRLAQQGQAPQPKRAADQNVYLIDGKPIVMPLPDKNNKGYEQRIQEWTTPELSKEQVEFRRLIRRERKKQAMLASMMIGAGRLDQVKWADVQTSFVDYGYWTRRLREYETEKQLRSAQAFGSLFFVLLGAPVGILFAKRDFLSAFITCFLPIIGVYYPLMLLGQNLGNVDMVHPIISLWSGNVLLGILGLLTFRPVLRH